MRVSLLAVAALSLIACSSSSSSGSSGSASSSSGGSGSSTAGGTSGSVGAGGDCYGGDDCQLDLYCTTNTDDQACPGQCVQRKQPGEACAGAELCTVGYWCPSGTCFVNPHNGQGEIGDACTFDEDCKADEVCGQTTFICRLLRSVGDACEFGEHLCGNSAYCDATGVCVANPTAGGHCEPLRETDGGFLEEVPSCPSGYYCDEFSANPTNLCQPQKPAGAACTAFSAGGLTLSPECQSDHCENSQCTAACVRP